MREASTTSCVDLAIAMKKQAFRKVKQSGGPCLPWQWLALSLLR
jgi:hypothetical protein